jgi:hypothetical protein
MLSSKDQNRAQYLLYADKVRALTEKNFRRDYIENKELRSRTFHLDHIVSIFHCWQEGIPPEIAADPLNLRIISGKDNLKKGASSDMTASELLEMVIDRDDQIDHFEDF